MNMHWFQREWWSYLLAPRSSYYDEPFYRVFWCRLRGHPYNYVWFNVGGTEPDYHCSNCGDDLG